MNRAGPKEVFDLGTQSDSESGLRESKERVKKRLKRDRIPISDSYISTLTHPGKKQIIISG